MKYKYVFSKQNKALLLELVRTDFKLRYQGSVLGYTWSLLRPLLLFAILYVVFVRFLKIGGDIPHYPVYLLLGIVLWNFFGEMTSQGLGSIVGRGDLIRKIRIPRWIIVFSTSVSALINLGLNLVVIAVFLLLDNVDITRNILAFPLSILMVYLFALGMALFLAAAFVKYRDIGYIWEVLMQAGFYLTPILYPLSMITSETFQKLILLNPMASAVQDARFAAVTQDEKVLTAQRVFDGGWLTVVPVLVTVVVLFVGVSYFRKQSKYFAENL